ncbi:3-deoxy-manno-octulosonate cytidylyltransferase [Alcanivorax sp. JB21]|uniref:3-deoxy-manno-octulosonate cytidylyltransferase n=1 Tax=Alcanivorax limicola TaxID=2874102 RepID=UPI001CC00B88|nr:3-deoxy-manno-octulosonate cytidylyltransferase [Alcanivorax limicola]MBZ2188015.1 3-deoxy-manno-octulosonate cytidylyltransferase [Alcanivorax limicola]
MTQFKVVIPARYAASRLPGKPLADIGGKPMVVRVYERCLESAAADVWVATDDARVADAVRDHGGQVLMTRGDHPSGTDRLQEVAAQLQLADRDILVNVQGDEPMIPPAVINQVADNLAANPTAGIATLCEPITHRSDVFSPDIVKVVFDIDGRALYFSRAPMPWHRDTFAAASDPNTALPPGNWWRHIGIYGYRVSLLNQYVTWQPAPPELAESLEQLRAMYHGVAIHVAPACAAVPGGVDTEADLLRMRALIASAPNTSQEQRG